MVDEVLIEAKNMSREEKLKYVYEMFQPTYWEKKADVLDKNCPRKIDIDNIIYLLRRRNGKNLQQFREQRNFIDVYNLTYLEAIFWAEILRAAKREFWAKRQVQREKEREQWLRSQGFASEAEYKRHMGWEEICEGVFVKPKAERAKNCHKFCSRHFILSLMRIRKGKAIEGKSKISLRGYALLQQECYEDERFSFSKQINSIYNG